MTDSYLTIAKPSTIEIKIKASRFIAETVSVSSSNDVDAALNVIRKREHAATHHCYAWRIGMDENEQFKYSDDGEPNGTAGRPIYDTLAGRNLTDTLVVVTRYFGGTKLGPGGLVRAYSQAAAEALDKSGTLERFLLDKLSFRIDFSYYDQVMRLADSIGAKVVFSDFAESVSMTLEIRKSRSDELKASLTELTHGRITFV